MTLVIALKAGGLTLIGLWFYAIYMASRGIK